LFESIFAEVATQTSIGLAKHLLSFRGIEIVVPNRYMYPFRPGVYSTNPEAIKKGFNFYVSNNSTSPLTLSFFNFVSQWKEGLKNKSYDLSIRFYLKEHQVIPSGKIDTFILPWKQVVLTCLNASFLHYAPPKDFFSIKLAAYDEFKNKFYFSKSLNEFSIRSDASYYDDELIASIDDSELEKVGWYRDPNGHVIWNKAKDLMNKLRK